jgi:hypothetical protein
VSVYVQPEVGAAEEQSHMMGTVFSPRFSILAEIEKCRVGRFERT